MQRVGFNEVKREFPLVKMMASTVSHTVKYLTGPNSRVEVRILKKKQKQNKKDWICVFRL